MEILYLSCTWEDKLRKAKALRACAFERLDMPKIKTKKTLTKRIKITKNGKLLRKQVGTGHLKVKWDSSRSHRKAKRLLVQNKGIIRKLKGLLRGYK